MKASEILRLAKSELEKRGIHRGDYGDIAGNGPICSGGALKLTLMVAGIFEDWRSAPMKCFYDATGTGPCDWGGPSIADWNDTSSDEDILLGFKRAIELAEEREHEASCG